jgi:hypothetical protein
MITSKYNKELGLLETRFEGIINIPEIVSYIKSLRINNNLPNGLKIYTNAVNASFGENIDPKQIEVLVKENFLNLEHFVFIYDVFVVSGAMEMALGQLYKEFSQADNYRFNIVSTKEVAIEWLNSI